MDQLVNAVTGLGPPRKAVLLKITREIPRGVYSRRNRFVWRPSPSGLNNNLTNSFVPTEEQMLQFHAMMQAQSTSGFQGGFMPNSFAQHGRMHDDGTTYYDMRLQGNSVKQDLSFQSFILKRLVMFNRVTL